MPRIRSIHPEACDSDKLAALPASAERTLWRLITHTDDDGRGEDRPKLLAAKLYPLVDDMDADAVDRDLADLEAVGLVVRYEVDGRRYYAIPTFGEWQSPRHPKPSRYPEPPPVTAVRGNRTAERGNDTADRRKPTAGEERRGEEVGEGNHSTAAVDSDDGFDEFWVAYPRGRAGKPGGDGARKPARSKWRRMTDDQRRLALVAVRHYAQHISQPDAPHAAHASTWLNQERWEQWQTPAQSTPPRSGAPPERVRRELVVGSTEWEARQAELLKLEEEMLGA